MNAGAQETGLPDSSYDVVVGEAMLTMQTDKHKLETYARGGAHPAAGRLLRHSRAVANPLTTCALRFRKKFRRTWHEAFA